MEFTYQYYENVRLQRQSGTICSKCGRTEIEHCVEPEKCCEERKMDPADLRQMILNP